MKKLFICAALLIAPVFAQAVIVDSALDSIGIWHGNRVEQPTSHSSPDVLAKIAAAMSRDNREGGYQNTSYQGRRGYHGSRGYDENQDDAASSSGESAVTVPAAGTIEVGFSPNRSAMNVALHVVKASTRSLDIAAYEFTNKRFEKAVVAAMRRGVQVRIVVDAKENVGKGASIAGRLAAVGAQVRYVDDAPLMHNKYLISDGETVGTGSLNFTVRAEKYNHENFRADWRNRALAQQYMGDFNGMWANGHPWR
jgi:phosphatidylserine/phosphatidylglycerophosphate/cardiolipin synthase-like enzyme